MNDNDFTDYAFANALLSLKNPVLTCDAAVDMVHRSTGCVANNEGGLYLPLEPSDSHDKYDNDTDVESTNSTAKRSVMKNKRPHSEVTCSPGKVVGKVPHFEVSDGFLPYDTIAYYDPMAHDEITASRSRTTSGETIESNFTEDAADRDECEEELGKVKVEEKREEYTGGFSFGQSHINMNYNQPDLQFSQKMFLQQQHSSYDPYISSNSANIKTALPLNQGNANKVIFSRSMSSNISIPQSARKNVRGPYKCSRCGELKTNHICTVIEDKVFCTIGTEMKRTADSRGILKAPSALDGVDDASVVTELITHSVGSRTVDVNTASNPCYITTLRGNGSNCYETGLRSNLPAKGYNTAWQHGQKVRGRNVGSSGSARGGNPHFVSRFTERVITVSKRTSIMQPVARVREKKPAAVHVSITGR